MAIRLYSLLKSFLRFGWLIVICFCFVWPVHAQLEDKKIWRIEHGASSDFCELNFTIDTSKNTFSSNDDGRVSVYMPLNAHNDLLKVVISLPNLGTCTIVKGMSGYAIDYPTRFLYVDEKAEELLSDTYKAADAYVNARNQATAVNLFNIVVAQRERFQSHWFMPLSKPLDVMVPDIKVVDPILVASSMKFVAKTEPFAKDSKKLTLELDLTTEGKNVKHVDVVIVGSEQKIENITLTYPTKGTLEISRVVGGYAVQTGRGYMIEHNSLDYEQTIKLFEAVKKCFIAVSKENKEGFQASGIQESLRTFESWHSVVFTR